MGQVTFGLKRSHFPGGLRILKPVKHTRQLNCTQPVSYSGIRLGMILGRVGGIKFTSTLPPLGVVLEPKCDSTTNEFILCTCIVKYAKSKSFLASPNQCDPGASLSKTIGIQGIQEDELAGSKKGGRAAYKYTKDLFRACTAWDVFGEARGVKVVG